MRKCNSPRTFATKLRHAFVVGAAGAVLLVSGSVWAQSPKKHEPTKDATKVRKKAKTSGSYFVLEDIKIEGKVYKPQAFHVINRKELSLRWDVGDPRFRGSFLNALLDSVKGDPF
ncbi:MAG: hypothetical protein J7M25_15335 [Deltaproteobacteria bacterium]|nr:hypothetical protein [Deltaproteobacteria bacterium]